MHKDKIVCKKICTKGQLSTIVKKKRKDVFKKTQRKITKIKKVTYRG